MKKLFSTALVASLFGIVLLTSCAKEEPEPPAVDAPPRDRFHGHWYFDGSSSIDGPFSYYVDVTDSTDANYILFSNLYGFNKKVHATYSGNSFTVPLQTVNGNNIWGSGTVANASTISVNFIVDQGAVNDTLTGSFTK